MVSPDSVQRLFTSGLAPAVQGQCRRWISGAQACPSFSRKQGNVLVDMTHANEQRPAATGNAADNVSDAPTGPATSAAARPTTVTADGTTATNAAASSTAKPAASTSWARETNPRRALLTIIVTVVVVVAIVLGLGFFVNWGLAALLVIIMIPGAISLAVLAKHPESTGGRSMFGISDPNTLLDPIRRPSERRGE